MLTNSQVDGNIHRLLTRLLAVHAPQTAPATIKFLWWAADDLVKHLPSGDKHKNVVGDWNQVSDLQNITCKEFALLMVSLRL